MAECGLRIKETDFHSLGFIQKRMSFIWFSAALDCLRELGIVVGQ